MRDGSVKKNNKKYNSPFIREIRVVENGNFRLDFSETMVDLEYLKMPIKDILIFLNAYKNEILELKYETDILSSYDESSLAALPQIESWNFININQFYIDLSIIFSSPLIVSKG